MIISPVINCHMGDTACVKGRLGMIHALPGVEWVHLDVADGKFTFNRTWAEAAEWKKLGEGLKLEVHLMVEDPEAAAGEWADAGAKRLIVHAETVNKEVLSRIVKMAAERGIAAMLAFSPETQIYDKQELLGLVREFQVLAVHPGLPGQKFLPLTANKILEIKSRVKNAMVEVDGGVTPEVAQNVKMMGADAVTSANYIFSSPDPQAAYKKLTGI